MAEQTIPQAHAHYHTRLPRLREHEIKRFWTKVEKTPDCWLWTAGKDRDGYGQYWADRIPVRAHVYSFLLHGGQIEAGKCVCHTCDNPSCIAPYHLWQGTDLQNKQDKKRKGRHVGAHKGEGHHKAKLTEGQVREMRQTYAAGGISQEAVGRLYGISQGHVKDIVSRKRWKHVE